MDSQDIYTHFALDIIGIHNRTKAFDGSTQYSALHSSTILKCEAACDRHECVDFVAMPGLHWAKCRVHPGKLAVSELNPLYKSLFALHKKF